MQPEPKIDLEGRPPLKDVKPIMYGDHLKSKAYSNFSFHGEWVVPCGVCGLTVFLGVLQDTLYLQILYIRPTYSCFLIHLEWTHRDDLCWRRAVASGILKSLLFTVFHFMCTHEKCLRWKNQCSKKLETCQTRVFPYRSFETWVVVIVVNNQYAQCTATVHSG